MVNLESKNISFQFTKKLSDKFHLERIKIYTENKHMKKIKDNEMYPKFEFRLSQEDKAWLLKELKNLKVNFNEDEDLPVVTKNTLIVAALKHGIRFLKSREKLSLLK